MYSQGQYLFIKDRNMYVIINGKLKLIRWDPELLRKESNRKIVRLNDTQLHKLKNKLTKVSKSRSRTTSRRSTRRRTTRHRSTRRKTTRRRSMRKTNRKH